MRRFLQVFCAVFSGLLLALAIPNELYKLGSPLIGLFSLAPLYLAVVRSKSYNEAFFVCALQALACHLASSFWLAFFHGYALFTLGASALGTAGYHGLFGWLYLQGHRERINTLFCAMMKDREDMGNFTEEA